MINYGLLIPSPFIGVINRFPDLRSLHSGSTHYKRNDGASTVTYLEDTALRTFIAGLAIFAVYNIGYSVPFVAYATMAISLPAALIAAGSCLMYFNTMALISAVAAVSFKGIALALVGIGLGYLINFNHYLDRLYLPRFVGEPKDGSHYILQSFPELPSYGLVEDYVMKKRNGLIPIFREAHAKRVVEWFCNKELPKAQQSPPK